MGRQQASLVAASLFALVAGCATTGELAPERETHSSPSGLYALELSRSFQERADKADQYDGFYAWRARDWIVGVIIDAPPGSMELLDEAVRVNALSSDLPAEIVRVRDVELGGLYARRTEIVLEVDRQKLLMLNTHTATQGENVQLVVSGPLADARAS